MALPIMATPSFKTIIPSTGEEIEYRPFLVKEEKVLLMALEGADPEEMSAATKKILQSCILSDIDVGGLAAFDIEFLFLRLRAKSVGEVIELKVGHADREEAGCDHRTEVNINIDDINVNGVSDNKVIMLTDTVGVKVSYPTFDAVLKVDPEDKDVAFKLIVDCIDVVFDGDNVYDEFTNEEMSDWLEGLNQKQFDKIADFFNEIPKLSHKVEWKCDACGKTESFEIEGLQSFFTFL
jgi:hypothetical protein